MFPVTVVLPIMFLHSMKKNILILTVVISLIAITSCSRKSSNTKASAENSSETTTTKVYSLTEESLPVQETASVDQANLKNEMKLGNNDSTVSVSFDGSRNKIETRYFRDHPRLLYIQVQTRVNGIADVTAYGRGGQLKTLEPDFASKAMTAHPDSIADNAGIIAPLKPVEIEQPSVARNPPVAVRPPTVVETTVPPAAPDVEPKTAVPSYAPPDSTTPKVQTQVSEVKPAVGKNIQ